MDYHALSRRELQALCKQYKIPANKTNVFMADALAALLNGADEDKTANVDTLAEAAPAAPADEPIPEGVHEGVVENAIDNVVASKKTRDRSSRRAAVVDADPLIVDDCIPAKSSSGRNRGRGIVVPAPTLISAEHLDVVEPSADSKKLAMKSKSVSALVKAATASDIPAIISAAIGVSREDNSDNIDVSLEEVPVEEAFAVRCDRSRTDGDLDEPMEGDVDVHDSLTNILLSEEKDIKGSLPGAECEEQVVPEVQPQDDLVAYIEKLSLEEAPVDGGPGKNEVRKRTGKRTGRSKKATINDQQEILAAVSSTTEAVGVSIADFTVVPTSADGGKEHKLAPKRRGRGNKAATSAPPLIESESSAAAVDVMQFSGCGNSDSGESEGMIPVIKKGSNAKKEAHASLPATDIAAPDGAIEMQPTGSDYVHHGVLAVKELLPDAGIPKPCNTKAQKAKKGARSTEFKGDLEALVAAADDVKLEATVPAAEEVERNNDSAAHEDSVDMEEESEIVKPKRVKGTRKKAGRNKGGKAKANSLNIEVYVDASFVKTAEVIEPDAPEPEPSASVANCHDGVSSPVKSHLGCESPVRSPSFAHVSSPPQSPSLAYMGNESDCEMDDPTPNVQQINQQSSPNTSMVFADEEADKENSGSKHNVTEIPKSLRKLRKQIKEAIIKKKSTPVSSPLKDISLNVQSPLMMQSPAFSFQF
ncbi:uncharacterized protein [Physcomitrium patens]|uniref:uncharacterized protein isoform X2 n=1 Tax=Physcomitrium patens TaxID=3218 RepID=UPI000D158521|nr:uncharacterized protein LOC112289641 isoform X2 [Physcomitrium patens]|eukprot:XP_024390794.1 uncharacterized protein LOC112289641 isoform X2 [Physcomitrella patens]